MSTFFYEDDSFINVFETFVNNNAHKIDLSTEEMKLECVLFAFSCRFASDIMDTIAVGPIKTLREPTTVSSRILDDISNFSTKIVAAEVSRGQQIKTTRTE